MARLFRIVLAAALLAVVAAGCGSEEEEATVQVAETEGIYLDVNGLKYQIEMSRYMNPNDVEDSEYFIGLPENSPPPTEDEIYFGVWVRVAERLRGPRRGRPPATGRSTTPRTTSTGRSRSTRTSTRSRSRPSTCRPRRCSRWPARPPARGRSRARCCCSRSSNESFQNRPLELRFRNGGGGQEGVYDLDV